MTLQVAWSHLAVLVIALVVQVHAKSKHVTVSLDSKWADTPILLETAEYLALESNDAFWKFTEKVAEMTERGATIGHDEEWYRLCEKFAGPILSPLQLKLMRFSLALRATSPAIEMYQQSAADKQPSDCEAFVEINSLMTCEEFAMKGFIPLAANEPRPTLIKDDHVYPGSEGRDIIVVLYAQMGTKPFSVWHKVLTELADQGKITYVLRHYIKDRPEKKLRLSGYGVELAIKSTEYKAKDDTKVEEAKAAEVAEDLEDEVQGFLFGTLNKLHPDKGDNLKDFRQHLVDSTNDLAPLKVWQLQDLSYQAAQRVLSVSPGDQLRTLRDISQNFPIMARSLVKTQVPKELRNEIKKNQEVFMNTYGLSPGDNALFINGLQVDLDIYDVFSLLDTMKAEARLMEGLNDLANQYSVSGDAMIDLLKLDFRDTDTNYAVDMRDDSIVYLNNLEKDRRYSGWPSSVQELLRPTFPGMLRHIRKNFHHLVFVVDPSDKEHKDLLKMAEAFLVHNAPVRIGLLFVVNPDPSIDGTEDAGVAMVRAFNYIRKNENPSKALSFITDIYERVTESDTPLDVATVTRVFAEQHDVSLGTLLIDGTDSRTDAEQRRVLDNDDFMTANFVMEEFHDRSSKAKKEKVFTSDEYDQDRKGAADFFKRTGLGDAPQVLINGAPMKRHEIQPEEFEEAVVSAILKQTQVMQTAVFNNQINDRTDLLEFVMTRPNVMPRLNSRVLSPSDQYVDLTASMPAAAAQKLDTYKSLSVEKKTAALLDSLHYLAKKDTDPVAVTTLVVGDYNTPEGRSLLYAALKHLKHSTETRIAIIHNPTSDPTPEDPHTLPVAIQAALSSLDNAMAKSYVTKLVKEDNVDALRTGEKSFEDLAVHNMDVSVYQKERSRLGPATFLAIHRHFCESVLGVKAGERALVTNGKAGERALITNGKVLGPLKPDEDFTSEDFDLLDKYTARVSGSKVLNSIKELGLDHQQASALTMQTAGLLTSGAQRESRKDLEYWGDAHSVVKLPPADPDGPTYQVVGVLDPATRAAQKYTPVLMVLQEVANVDIEIFFNCREKLSEMPLKNFYRFVLEPELSFTVDSKLSSGPEAKFVNMPEAPLLTLGMDPPESWLVESVRTAHDLDNIHLEEMTTGVHASFELEYLLLEGHCYDSVTSQPPRGLQFILGTNKTRDMVDTIVMANLGYFQLKATPGVWNLRLRAGRSEDIYEITNHENTDSPSNSPNVLVVMDSFKTQIIRMRVTKKSGKENEELLTEEEPTKGIWDSISSSLTGGGTAVDVADNDVINIFSLASGHLYERFLRIMMLSVLKNTQSKVKFWFLKNYLSPTFKDFIPHMAQKYKFDYELVQYKWPRWLHQQTEKQRIIWGYKILFLDVLFPLNVNKIIFVDADQIVRTDLKELVEFDLEGAPYGYTPFCDSRKEMDGFRFWRSGYWASHLAGRKYHISALYVVDLKKFRKIAAGDRLRGQYQGLSQDPNSLSNLDQDLPNNMIHQVAIKTLPQEWLYCDTWCHESTLAKAKTIDLCNNPLTKEPKLSAALRIVPEWRDYDSEVKRLWDETYGTNTAGQSNTSDGTHSTDKKKTEL